MTVENSSPGKILLFGGTTEGRRLAQKLSERGKCVTVCVATQTGADYLKGIAGLKVLTGRMDTDAMALLMEEGYDLCIDATHPYAVEASSSIRRACGRNGLPYYRLIRRVATRDEVIETVRELVSRYLQDEDQAALRRLRRSCSIPQDRFGSLPIRGRGMHRGQFISDGHSSDDVCCGADGADFPRIRTCVSADDACRMLAEYTESMRVRDSMQSACAGGESSSGTADLRRGILLTCGAKEAAHFAPVVKAAPESVYVRVLPYEDSISRCIDAGFSRDHILTGKGPFTVEENVRAIGEYHIRIIVTKDSGMEGGYPQKLAAAALCGCDVIVISRPAEEGFSEEEILLQAPKQNPQRGV